MLGIKKAFYGLAILALLLVLFQHGSAYNGTTTSTTSTSTIGAGGGFARTRGVNFLLNGRPFFSNGFNAYWLMYMASDPAGRSRVTSVFQQASTFGMKVARTWAFSDGGYKPLQLSPGTYDEVMFKGLDFVISEARKYGVYLILSLVNNWNDFGGRKQYVQWAKDRGQSLSSDDDFYRNDLVKGFYKNHVQAVLTRVNTITGVSYKDDPTIFAWELINEPRCQSDLSGRTLQDWITEMAAHVKSIDSNHLLAVGMEGFYGESVPERKQFNPGPAYVVGTDFISNNRVPGIDFATIHAYPDQWKQGSNEQEQLGFLRSWVQSHVEDSGAVLGRPLLVTEFGKSSGLPGYTVALRDAFYGAVYDFVYASARSGGPCAGGLFWQLLTEGMGNLGDGYEIVLSGDQQCPPSTANIISEQSRRISTQTSSSSIPSSNINNMTNSTEKKKKKKTTEEESVEGGKLP